MIINSINQQQKNQNFKGSLINKVTSTLVEHPKAVAMLAGSSVVAQKIVMSGSEATVGPLMDVGIGKVITKVTDEKDGRTNESSKVQAIRTFSQSVGGTIVGVGIRLLCIGAITALFMKAGEKAGGKIASVINEGNKLNSTDNRYEYTKQMQKWGKVAGGAVATLVMLVTNFIIDAPFINWINKKVTNLVDKKPEKAKAEVQEQKEVK